MPPDRAAAVPATPRPRALAARQQAQGEILRAIRHIAFPAKAGTHFSARLQADRWIPAFAGNAVYCGSSLAEESASLFRQIAGQRLVIGGGEAGGIARDAVERRLQRAGEMASHAVVEGGLGVDAAGLAEPVEPAHTRRDMTDLVAIDTGENGRPGAGA